VEWEYRQATSSQELDEEHEAHVSIRLSHNCPTQDHVLTILGHDCGSTRRLTSQYASSIVRYHNHKAQRLRILRNAHIDEHLEWRPPARENARPLPDMLGDLYVQRKSCLYRIGTVKNTYYREPSPRLKGNKPREIVGEWWEERGNEATR
jgi:hypothetical protein